MGVDRRRYVGIWALKRVGAQFVGGGLNRDLASDRQGVYIHLMTRTSDRTPSERAELLLAGRTRFRMSPDAWGRICRVHGSGIEAETKTREAPQAIRGDLQT